MNAVGIVSSVRSPRARPSRCFEVSPFCYAEMDNILKSPRKRERSLRSLRSLFPMWSKRRQGISHVIVEQVRCNIPSQQHSSHCLRTSRCCGDTIAKYACLIVWLIVYIRSLFLYGAGTKRGDYWVVCMRMAEPDFSPHLSITDRSTGRFRAFCTTDRHHPARTGLRSSSIEVASLTRSVEWFAKMDVQKSGCTSQLIFYWDFHPTILIIYQQRSLRNCGS